MKIILNIFITFIETLLLIFDNTVEFNYVPIYPIAYNNNNNNNKSKRFNEYKPVNTFVYNQGKVGWSNYNFLNRILVSEKYEKG